MRSKGWQGIEERGQSHLILRNCYYNRSFRIDGLDLVYHHLLVCEREEEFTVYCIEVDG